MSSGGCISSVEDKCLETGKDLQTNMYGGSLELQDTPSPNNRGMKRVFDHHNGQFDKKINHNRDEDIYGPRDISNWADIEEYGSKRQKQGSGSGKSCNGQCKNFRDKRGEEPTDNSKNRNVPQKGRESESRKHGRRGQQNKYDQNDNRQARNNKLVDRSRNIKVASRCSRSFIFKN